MNPGLQVESGELGTGSDLTKAKGRGAPRPMLSRRGVEFAV